MTDIEIPTIPDELSPYDWRELAVFDRKVSSEGWGYAVDEYPPRFEFAGYEPLPSGQLRELHRREKPGIERRWRENPAAMVDAHNAHLDEADRRADHRALWAVRFGNGEVHACPSEELARGLHGDDSCGRPALLTRDEPGGQWREVSPAGGGRA